ncbi:MAG: EamA family transporter [Bacteroidota bacterium]|nr:EamA family transporter [Bacteroidota bacterium]
MWKFYALMSALFAALTAILAKVGIKGINSNLATAIRTTVILGITWGIVIASGNCREIKTITRNNLIFLILSGIATGLSWLCYFKAISLGAVSKVAPIDKLSVAVVIILSVFLLKEPSDPKVLIGAGLIVAGSIVILL